MDDPGANLRGTVTLSSTASDAGSGIASRVYAYSPAGAGTWTTTPAAFDTTAVTDGLYDLRVTVTDNAGNSNHLGHGHQPPGRQHRSRSATMDDPGANLSGTVTLSSTASDPGGSGVATVTYQHSPAGAGTWTTTPAAFDTTAVTDGLYDLRVIVTDNAGNQTTSATVANRRVDNDAPTISLTAPSGYVNAAAPDPFTVTATSPDGDISEVEFFRCSNSSVNCGSGSWVSLGTDSAAPYSASWNVDADGRQSASCRGRGRGEQHRLRHRQRDHRPDSPRGRIRHVRQRVRPRRLGVGRDRHRHRLRLRHRPGLAHARARRDRPRCR